MKVTPAGFAHMTAMLLQTVSCPVCCALEGGYNRLVTSECCEAVLRVLLGEQAPMPPPQLLSRCCEPALRAVVSTQKAHWPVLSDDSEGVLDRFFAEAAAVGQPGRMSKRARAAPTRQYEDEPDPCKSFHSPRSGASLTAKSPKLDAEAAALKAAVDKTAKTLARTEEAHAKAAHKVDVARQTLTREESALGAAEEALESARKAHEVALAAAAAAVAAVASSSSDPSDETGDREDDTNGTTNPQPTCLWSATVKCEVGRRVFAQYGSSAD
jgi:acetoin utilization deacetylase AcuC-like enzyme